MPSGQGAVGREGISVIPPSPGAVGRCEGGMLYSVRVLLWPSATFPLYLTAHNIPPSQRPTAPGLDGITSGR
jgi:hypothetical protein